MKSNCLTATVLAATLAFAPSAAFGTTARRIHVPAQDIPHGISPELVNSLVLEAEEGLENFRHNASSKLTAPSAPNAEHFVTLQRQRVKVTIDWRDPGSGRSGKAFALPQEDRFSFFYYEDPNNPEIFVKVLDFGSASPFLVFYAGLTSFEYTVTFENVCTGQKAVKFKPGGSAEGGFDNTSLSWCDPLGSPLAVPGVYSLNGATGDVVLAATGAASITRNGASINVNVPVVTPGVPSVNGIIGLPVSIMGTGGTSVATSGSTVTIASPPSTGTDQAALPPIFAVGKTVFGPSGKRGTSGVWQILQIQAGWIACTDYYESSPKKTYWLYVPAFTEVWGAFD